MKIGFRAALLLVAWAAWAQTPNLHPGTNDQPAVATVTFSFALPGASPGHYSISVDATGKAAYRADELAPAGNSGPGDTYMYKFEVSPATTQRILDAARKANYFVGDFDFRGHRMANMGSKTLRYTEGNTDHEATYNYSQNPAIQELTTLFQRLNATLEFGRRLAYEHRFDRLGLEAELKSMADQEKRGNLAELQVDAPILQAIADDHAVMNISRHQAQALLDKAKASPVAEKSAAGPR